MVWLEDTCSEEHIVSQNTPGDPGFPCSFETLTERAGERT